MFRRLLARKSTKPREVEIVVPRADIVCVNQPRRGLWDRLFGPAFPRFTVAWRSGGSETVGAFAADPSSDLVRRLRELRPRPS